MPLGAIVLLTDGGDARGVFAEHVYKIRKILARLDVAHDVDDLDLPDFHLHGLKGSMDGLWSITVRANCRIVFRFEEGEALDVDYVDYH